MTHQDNLDSLTAVTELKALFSDFDVQDSGSCQRHGNARISVASLATSALILFGMVREDSLSARFQTVRKCIENAWDGSTFANSRQALFKALASCGDGIVQRVRKVLEEKLASVGSLTMHGRQAIAVDGSQFAIPRTKQNIANYAAAPRKGKKGKKYKKSSDKAKATTTQIALSLCYHVGSGMPICWSQGTSADGERSQLLGMLDQLPNRVRLILDAGYYGYDFWKSLIDKNFTFVMRAGSNIELLKSFEGAGKTKIQKDKVFYWPKYAMEKGQDPIVLRLVEVMVGKKRMYLLTNEWELTEAQLAKLYEARWGIEVFFRTLKQSYERAKLRSKTPSNAKVELDWTILGIWFALLKAKQCIGRKCRISAIEVLRKFDMLITAVAIHGDAKINLEMLLKTCVAADESGRQSNKDSPDYPRRKAKKTIGIPKLLDCTEPQKTTLMEYL